MHLRISLAAFAALSIASTSAFAEKTEKSEKKEEELPAERTSLSVAAAPLLPVGRFSDAFVLGVGGTIGIDYAVHPHAQIIGRTGYVHHLPKAGLDVTLGALPIWGGARYTFGVDEGAYLEGALGPNILFATVTANRFGTVSDNEVKLGTSLGGGYRTGKIDAGARLVFWDIGHAGDSMGIMATVGVTFASF
jgi:hypothetical protein